MIPRTILRVGTRQCLPSRFTIDPPARCSAFFRPFRTPHSRNFGINVAGRFKLNATLPKDVFNPKNWSRERKIVVFVLSGCLAYYVYHLEQVPVTGRIRFMDVSPESERVLGEQTFHQLAQEFQDKILPPEHVLTRHVQRVVNRILEGSQLGQVASSGSGGTGAQTGGEEGKGTLLGDPWSDGEPTANDWSPAQHLPSVPLRKLWKVLVVNDDNIVNALATNGTVIVFTGILPLCVDENGLAAVVGHEIAHTLARHPAERVSSMRLFALIGIALDYAFSIDGLFSELVMKYAFQLPNFRVQELEADRIGLTLTAQACYDPQAVPIMQKRLALLESRNPKRVEFLQTHPSSERRAKILETYLPDAYSLQASSSFCATMAAQLNAFGDSLNLMLGSSSTVSTDEFSSS